MMKIGLWELSVQNEIKDITLADYFGLVVMAMLWPLVLIQRALDNVVINPRKMDSFEIYQSEIEDLIHQKEKRDE
jgi:hypothetical protein